MKFAFGTKEPITEKYFIRDLKHLKVEKGKAVPVWIGGIVSQLCISGNDIAAFLLEDTTGVFKCEFFMDRCSFGDNFLEGMPVKLRGELRYNNYDELIVRVHKLSRFG